MEHDKKFYVIILIVLICVGLLFIVMTHGARNTAIGMEENIANAKSQINVQEKRRSDLIPKLVECVKEYDKHEYEVLMAIVGGRSNSDEASEEIKIKIQAVAEAYPELKSNENYKTLMTELALTENSIANYRNAYNERVKEYNRHVRRFPQTLFFNIVKYEPKTYKYLEFETKEIESLFGS